MKKLATILFMLPVAAHAQYYESAHAHSDAFDNPWTLLLISVVSVVVTIYTTRAIFSIPRLVRSATVTNYLLALIAEKNDCDTEKIRKAMKHMAGDIEAGELPPYLSSSADDQKTSTDRQLQKDIKAQLEKLKWRHNLGEITQKEHDEERARILGKV